MPPTTPERYAVVSCHVERPLDDRVWTAFAALQERRPGGLAIAALIRPPDAEAGESDEGLWLVPGARGGRPRAARPSHALHRADPRAADAAARPGSGCAREGAWLRAHGLWPTLFCGGGWYTDRSVALACAELGYVDCTPRAKRPSYLPNGAAWAELAAPARVDVDGRTLAAVPTTHAAGDLVRAILRLDLPPRVHVYFHDTDLVDRRRRAMIVAGLDAARTPAAGGRPRRDRPSVRDHGPPLSWEDVARGEAAAPRRRILACRARHPQRALLGPKRAPGPSREAGPRRPRRHPPLPRVSAVARPALRPAPPGRQRHDARRGRRGRARARRLPGPRPALRRLRGHRLLVAPLGHGAGRVAAVPRADHRARLPAGGPLRAARASRRLGEDPRRARARRPDRARVRVSGRTTTSRPPG